MRLGLHRLRLEGELTEIRADDLRFSLPEAQALFAAGGVELAEPTLGMLYQRTEGWAAGLRLAALSLAGHPDPERFAAESSGTERTVVRDGSDAQVASGGAASAALTATRWPAVTDTRVRSCASWP